MRKIIFIILSLLFSHILCAKVFIQIHTLDSVAIFNAEKVNKREIRQNPITDYSEYVDYLYNQDVVVLGTVAEMKNLGLGFKTIQLDDCYIASIGTDAMGYELLTSDVRFSDVLSISKAPVDEDLLWSKVSPVVSDALKGFIDMRLAEGVKLSQDVLSRADLIISLVEKVVLGSLKCHLLLYFFIKPAFISITPLTLKTE